MNYQENTQGTCIHVYRFIPGKNARRVKGGFGGVRLYTVRPSTSCNDKLNAEGCIAPAINIRALLEIRR